VRISLPARLSPKEDVMKRFVRAALATFAGFLLLAAGSASAQVTVPYGAPAYGPFYQPMLSPWLNLLRGGDPAANYFLGVLPEMQRRQNARVFGAAIQTLDQRAAAPAATPEELELYTPLRSTGHATAFNNTLNYFNTNAPRTTPTTPRRQQPQAPGGPPQPGRPGGR
jgi:hypothetical protein